jgi:hypothetical protein
VSERCETQVRTHQSIMRCSLQKGHDGICSFVFDLPDKSFTQRDLDLAVLEARIEEAKLWNKGNSVMHNQRWLPSNDAEADSYELIHDREKCWPCLRLANLQKQKAELPKT